MNKREQAIALINQVCCFYNIDENVLRVGGKVYERDKNKVRLSEIRMALSYFLYKHCPLKLVEIAALVGYSSHSTISTYRNRVQRYIDTEDDKFLPYYFKVIDIASDLDISMRFERVLSYSDIVFEDCNKKLVYGNS